MFDCVTLTNTMVLNEEMYPFGNGNKPTSITIHNLKNMLYNFISLVGDEGYTLSNIAIHRLFYIVTEMMLLHSDNTDELPMLLEAELGCTIHDIILKEMNNDPDTIKDILDIAQEVGIPKLSKVPVVTIGWEVGQVLLLHTKTIN